METNPNFKADRERLEKAYDARLEGTRHTGKGYEAARKVTDVIILLTETCGELLEALESAKQVIRVWHDMGTKGEESLWQIYQQSPEMQKINAAIAKAKGEK